jgi:hypothetical protein
MGAILNNFNRMMEGKSPNMEKLLEEMSTEIFGRSRSLAAAGDQCVCCGKSATDFRDELSRREYRISRLYQGCQDKVFAEPEE